jgi:hypothetical protein
MKLRNASKTIKMYPSMPDGPSMPEEKEVYQRLCFKESMLPELSSWKVGETYKLIIEVKMTEHSLEEEDGKEVEEGDFDVLAVGAHEEPQDTASRLAKDKFGM